MCDDDNEIDLNEDDAVASAMREDLAEEAAGAAEPIEE